MPLFQHFCKFKILKVSNYKQTINQTKKLLLTKERRIKVKEKVKIKKIREKQIIEQK